MSTLRDRVVARVQRHVAASAAMAERAAHLILSLPRVQQPTAGPARSGDLGLDCGDGAYKHHCGLRCCKGVVATYRTVRDLVGEVP